jgi:hypothetical protein
LETETQYGIYLNGITDLEGQGLSSGATTYAYFTTGAGTQSAAPTVVLKALKPFLLSWSLCSARAASSFHVS